VRESIASGTLTELVSRWSLEPGLESQPDSLSAALRSEPT